MSDIERAARSQESGRVHPPGTRVRAGVALRSRETEAVRPVMPSMVSGGAAENECPPAGMARRELDHGETS